MFELAGHLSEGKRETTKKTRRHKQNTCMCWGRETRDKKTIRDEQNTKVPAKNLGAVQDEPTTNEIDKKSEHTEPGRHGSSELPRAHSGSQRSERRPACLSPKSNAQLA